MLFKIAASFKMAAVWNLVIFFIVFTLIRQSESRYINRRSKQHYSYPSYPYETNSYNDEYGYENEDYYPSEEYRGYDDYETYEYPVEPYSSNDYNYGSLDDYREDYDPNKYEDQYFPEYDNSERDSYEPYSSEPYSDYLYDDLSEYGLIESGQIVSGSSFSQDMVSGSYNTYELLESAIPDVTPGKPLPPIVTNLIKAIHSSIRIFHVPGKTQDTPPGFIPGKNGRQVRIDYADTGFTPGIGMDAKGNLIYIVLPNQPARK